MSDFSESLPQAKKRPQRASTPFSIALQNFTSQFFLIPQGTGIIAVILHQLHYQFHGLHTISVIFYLATLALLASFFILYLLRLLLFPRKLLKQLSTNLQETACLSSLSISFTSLIQMTALIRASWADAIIILWWINVGFTVLLVFGCPYVFVTLESPGLDSVPPAIFLPLIAALTAAAGGGVICSYAHISSAQEIPVLVVSYLLLGLGLPLAVALEGVFLARLFDQSFPNGEKVYQLMMICGPLGQGSFALQSLGQCVRNSVAGLGGMLGAANELRTIGAISQFLGLMTFGYGTFWLGFAVLAIVTEGWKKPGIMRSAWTGQLSAWALVFPLGVYTTAAVQLGRTLHSTAFDVFSTILAIILVMLWLANASTTLWGVVSGKVLGLERGWSGWYD